MVLPDKITLFQVPIEEICSNDDEVIEEVRQTVVHEVAHHFGIDDGHAARPGSVAPGNRPWLSSVSGLTHPDSPE